MNDETHLHVLRLLQSNPNLTQRELADQLGVSLGKTNYCIKALIAKGWVKLGNFGANPTKRDYLYLLTPKGIAGKAALTIHFLERKGVEYEQLCTELLQQRPQPQAVQVIDDNGQPKGEQHNSQANKGKA